MRTRSRLVLLSSLHDSTQFIAPGQIKIKYLKNKKETYQDLPAGILIHLSFLNPSPHDIAFFQLGFHTQDKVIEAYTQKSVSYLSADNLNFIYTFPNSGYMADLNMPLRPYGIFKANSYVAFDFFMPIRADDDRLPKCVTFKIRYAVSKFPYFGKKSRFKTCKLKIDTSTYFETIQELQKQMQELTKTKLNYPSKSPHHLKK
ncbi:hypothetical protein [Ligilactobacillus salivarius]|nr:hypothetical protein [Ligilactobacillus salivarius]ATP36114.1 hypothetical protein CR249_00415 [Ligilactobacillus salivarius]OQR05270.1 hypothetical protein B6U49_03110 [Ligilactobacillus salivarius]